MFIISGVVLVIVEGGLKAIRKYKKVMANRRWDAGDDDGTEIIYIYIHNDATL